MKPNEILEPVTMLSTVATDLQFWLSDEKKQTVRFNKIEVGLSVETSGYLLSQIPDSLKPLPPEDLSDLSYQIKYELESLTGMLQNLDLKKSTYVLHNTDFVLTPEFHRIVYLTVFNALNLLRSFDRALSRKFHPSGNIGLKSKETSKGLLEKIYHSLESEGMIKQGNMLDFKAIFTDSYLPGTWQTIIFNEKRGIRQFPFDLIEFITGKNVEPETVNKYFRINGGKKDGKFDSNDINKNQEKKIIKGTLYRNLIKNIRPIERIKAH